MAMNRYGRAALAHWRRHLPRQYATLPDPVAYFIQLGEKAERQAGEMRDAMVLAGTPAGGETAAQRSHRIAAVRDEVDRIVFPELIRPPAAVSPDSDISARGIALPPPPS